MIWRGLGISYATSLKGGYLGKELKPTTNKKNTTK
jgi:hypothetical protein